MPYPSLTPAEFQPGDRLMGPDSPGPLFQRLGEPYEHPEFGSMTPVYFEGADEPRDLATDGQIIMYRPEPEDATP